MPTQPPFQTRERIPLPKFNGRPVEHVEPLYQRRDEASKLVNDAFFVEARKRDGRISPDQWKTRVKPNTTQQQKEKTPAGNLVRGKMGLEREIRLREKAVDGQRVPTVIGRGTGVTKEDREMSQRVKDDFFAATKTQEDIERFRAWEAQTRAAKADNKGKSPAELSR